MNLPPAWVDFLENEGFQAIHWSNAGAHGFHRNAQSEGSYFAF
jgi:predicted nuclease of predicted toxin-antitoxin system